MNEKELGKTLLNQEAPINATALSGRIMRRDRRRLWFAGIACVIAWMLVVMVPWATTLPMLAKVIQHEKDKEREKTRVLVQQIADSQPADSAPILDVVYYATIVTFLCSIGSMFLAAICTVFFITLSRRVTLRQVNASLEEISTQLKTFAANTK